MEDEPVDDMTEVAALPANVGMEIEPVTEIEPLFHANANIDNAVSPTGDNNIVAQTDGDDVVAPMDGDDSDIVALGGIKNETDTPMVLQDEEFLFTKDGHYICDICGEIMAVRSSAEQHMIAHFEKMVTEECEPTDPVTNDVTVSNSIESSVQFVTNESLNNPLQFQLNEVSTECSNDLLTLKSNKLVTAGTTASQSAESITSNKHYKCDICGAILSNKTSIVEQHVGSHFETKPFQCYFCSFSTNEKYRIIQHIMSTHFGWELGRPFTCCFCTYSCNEKSRLTRHMLTHSGEKPFACDICGFRFNRKDSLTKHMRVHAGKKVVLTTEENEIESDSHSSRHTSGTTASEFDQQPISATASSVEEVEPPMIVKVEPSDVAIEDVVMSGSENEPSKNQPLGNGTIQLVILSDKLDGLANQQLQLQLKTSETVGQDWGPVRGHHLDPLNSEITQAEDSFIQCDVCDYRTAKKYRYKLREHMNVHTGERPFACDLCDQKFSRKRNLDRHRLSHSGETRFACKLCDYACKQKSNLTKHMKTHLGHETSNSNGQDESNDTSQSNASPSALGFTVMSSVDCELSESCSLGDDVVIAEVPQDDVVMPQQNSIDQPVDPLQLRLNEEHSQDSGLSSSSGPKTLPTSNKRFTCDFCTYKSDRKFEFEVHLRTHTGEKPFACDLCDKRYIARKTLNRHRKTHLLEKRCSSCDFTALRESDLATHMSSHTEDKAVVFLKGEGMDNDELTDKPFQLELREEQSRDSGPSGSSYETTESGDKLFMCDVCSYTTKQKVNLEGHMMIHSGEKLHVCDYCDKSYTAKRTLDKHIRDCHGEKLFNCGSCDYTSVRKSDLADHIKTHIKTETGNVPCVEVNEVKHDPPDGSTELLTNQGSNNSAPGTTLGVNIPEEFSEHFKCVHCDFECDDITEWSAHMFMHTNEKSYSCEHCEYKTKSKASMDVHKTIHLEKSSATVTVTCEYCDYPFTTKADMNLHIMSCHSELYMSCDVCDFKAFHKRSMELHKATHLKPFTCNICDFKFDKESLLTRHIMTAHSDVTQFACSSCDYKANNIADVEQHILNTHSLPPVQTGSTCVAAPTHPDPVKQFKCYACDFTASKISQVEEHILNSHAVLVQDMSAPLLNPELPGNRSDAPSSSSNTGSEMYSCYACDYEANSVAQVQQHILITHNAPTTETTASPMDVGTGASNPVTPL